MMPTDSASSPIAAQLRRRHHDLARRCLSAPIGADERQSFIDELVAAGSVLAPGRDRDAVRKLLYYWAADAASRGDRPRDQPPPALQPYDGDGATARPVDMAILTVESSSEDVEATTADTRSAIRIATLARQWLAENRNEGYLLTGEALKEADRIKTNDADIQMLVDASKDAEARQEQGSKRRLRMLVAGLATIVVVLGVGAFSLLQTKRELERVIDEKDDALVELSAAAGRETQRTRDDVRRALDALARGGEDPLGPLKALLKRLGEAQSYELDRLRYQQPDAATVPQGDRVVVASDPGAQAPVRPPPTGASTCDGFLWLGSDAAKLINHDGSLSGLQGNETVKVNDGVNIRLRKAMPSDDYVMAPQVGLVPGGATLILTGKPKPFARPGGVTQFFAPVKSPRQYCTRVFIQYAGDRQRADDVRARLVELSVQVPPAQKMEKAPGAAQVRFFLPEDQPMADQVASRLSPFNGDKKLQLRPLFDFPTKPAPGTIEVWIELKP